MSFFKSAKKFLKSSLTGATTGLLTGGLPGAIFGGVAGGLRVKDIIPGANVFSASPVMRQTPVGLVALPTNQYPLASPLEIFKTAVGGAMASSGYPMALPGGALVSQTGARQAPVTGMYSYRRAYTKRGTPRRIRRDGQPYAIPRMNPMNYRAARRAVTRIRGARKLLQRIERSLPRVASRRRAA